MITFVFIFKEYNHSMQNFTCVVTCTCIVEVQMTHSNVNFR